MKNVMFLLLISSVLFIAISCDDDDDPDMVSKQFVLVHGSWQGAFIWDEVKAQLEDEGHKVAVVELPAHGEDNTPPADVTMPGYQDKVVAAINNLSEDVILVGHSMGGSVIIATAESIPDKIEKLVYIGAFVPGNGQTLLELAGQDSESLLGPSLIPSEDMLTLGVDQDELITIFCQDCSETKKQLLLEKYRTEPAIPFTHPFTVTEDNFGQVDKYYIHTAQDHTIGLALQESMADAADITQTYTLNSGHSPFLSMPDQLAALLLEIVE